MSDLTPEDRALLDLAREAHEPTAADRSRVRTALIAQLGVSTGLTAAAAASSSTAAAGMAGVAGAGGVASASGAAALASGGGAAAAATSTTFVLAAKVLTAIGIAGAVAGGGVAAHRALRAPEAPVTAAPQIAAAQSPLVDRGSGASGAPKSVAPPSSRKMLEVEVANTVSEPAHPQSAIVAAPAREEHRTMAPTLEARPSLVVTMGGATQGPPQQLPPPPPPNIGFAGFLGDPPSAAGSTASLGAAPAPAALAGEAAAPRVNSEREVAVPLRPASPTTLEAETRLVRAGVASLHGHDPGRALALFDQHAKEYPSGALAEERAAARVNALCDLGQTSNAQAAAGAFLRDRPSSPLAARVRMACPNPHGARTNP